MKFSSYQEACQVAKEIDKKLSAYDFHPSNLVEIIHEEGTLFHYKCAFIREWKDYIFVFTEHHGFHVYHKSDLYFYGEYKLVSKEKLMDTGYVDKCEFCYKEFKVEDLEYNNHPDPSKYNSTEYFTYCISCHDIESSQYKDLWKYLNEKKWDFTWGRNDIEHIKKACATVMKEDTINNWLDAPSKAFPKTPRETDYEDVYLAIYNMGI